MAKSPRIQLRLATYILVASGGIFCFASSTRGFTPLIALHPQISTSSPAFPAGRYEVSNLLDGNDETEYASDSAGTNTFVEFTFDAEPEIAAFRHVDREDRALVLESTLTFYDQAGNQLATRIIPHSPHRGGETFAGLAAPVHASRVRWQPSRLAEPSLGAVGGASITFYRATETVALPRPDNFRIAPLPFLTHTQTQIFSVELFYGFLEPADVILQISDTQFPVHLAPGRTVLEVPFRPASTATNLDVALLFGSSALAKTTVIQTPITPFTLYIVPHSHTDIGYTDTQANVEKRQVANLLEGIRMANATEDYPEGARFVWNVEVLWAVDHFLERMDDSSRHAFAQAVRNGQVELNAAYLNVLSGLCGPEELLRSFDDATRLSRQFGTPITAAMFSDVPGLTWGTVTAMTQAGVHYLSSAPNYGEKPFMRQWENRPFYWLGPDGKERVLVWVPWQGYALSHQYDRLSAKVVAQTLGQLANRDYPYNLAYIRWAGHGDNGAPDAQLSDFVRDWNNRFLSPRLMISGTSEPFRKLEQRYGPKLPIYKGDWTPYWEDGAASSARETALNRNASSRLTQAETLYALVSPARYPARRFDEAWRNILLYSEHTWGSSESIRSPESPQTRAQWAVKKGYADTAEKLSSELIDAAVDPRAPASATSDFDVVNTLTWARSGLVTIAPQFGAGDYVEDETGHKSPCQRLSSGELVFFAHDVPPLAAKSYRLVRGELRAEKTDVRLTPTSLVNKHLHVTLGPSGSISELRTPNSKNFAAGSPHEGLNQFLYVTGQNGLEHDSSTGTIKIGEQGPVISSLVAINQPPGTKEVRREYRLIAGQDYIEVFDVVDKDRLLASDYRARSGKESAFFAFPFTITNPQVSLELPLCVIRPLSDQIPAACTGWYTVNGWLDVANGSCGVTWISLDAPLVKFDEPTLGSWRSTNPTAGQSGRVYSWLMNNRWGTNYRAYQEGKVMFRYILRPHATRGTTSTSCVSDKTRFAAGFSQPLLAIPPEVAAHGSLFTLSSPSVATIALKPADSGNALVLRLYETAGKPTKATVRWGARKPAAMFISNTSETALQPAPRSLAFGPHQLITLRAQFP
jgi:alpha-mannosidase